MPYKHVTNRGVTFYLHGKRVSLPGGRWEMCFSFARVPRPAETVAALPAGYSIFESPYTHRPYLRKIGHAVSGAREADSNARGAAG
jgi:hypothetical protein